MDPAVLLACDSKGNLVFCARNESKREKELREVQKVRR